MIQNLDPFGGCISPQLPPIHPAFKFYSPVELSERIKRLRKHGDHVRADKLAAALAAVALTTQHQPGQTIHAND